MFRFVPNSFANGRRWLRLFACAGLSQVPWMLLRVHVDAINHAFLIAIGNR